MDAYINIYIGLRTILPHPFRRIYLHEYINDNIYNTLHLQILCYI